MIAILEPKAKISFVMRSVCDAHELRKVSIGLKTVLKKSDKNPNVFRIKWTKQKEITVPVRPFGKNQRRLLCRVNAGNSVGGLIRIFRPSPFSLLALRSEEKLASRFAISDFDRTLWLRSKWKWNWLDPKPIRRFWYRFVKLWYNATGLNARW